MSVTGNYSARSNFKTRSRDENISTYFATNYAGLTLAAPSGLVGKSANPASTIFESNGGTVPDDRNVVCNNNITGIDTETNYGPPTGSPLWATVLYGVYFIDYYAGFNVAGVADSTRAGVDTVAPITFETVTINGVSTTALCLTLKAVDNTVYNHASHVVGYRQQLWGTFYRNITTGGHEDLSVVSFSGFMWINDLSDKYYIPVSGSTGAKNRTTLIDWKAGTASNGGDYRVGVIAIAATTSEVTEFGAVKGQRGWEITLDNQANANPALTPSHDEYVRFKTFTVPVPEAEWFEYDFYFKRGVDVSDTTTGRFVFRIKVPGDTEWTTVCDLTAASVAQYNIDHPNQALFPSAQNCRMITMGSRGDKMQRLFFGQYSNRLNTDFTVKFAKVRFKTGLTD